MKTKEEIKKRLTLLEYENQGLQDLRSGLNDFGLYVEYCNKIAENITIIETLKWTLNKQT